MLAGDEVNSAGKHRMCHQIRFSERIPNSLIVFDSEDSVAGKLEKLCRKYIWRNAEYQINISFRDRRALQSIVESEEHVGMDIIDALDSCIVELWQLLRDSYARFQRTAEYKQMCQRR